MVTITVNHEEAMIRAFIQKNRQERCLYLLADNKRRIDFTRKLAHFRWLDERFAYPITSSTAHSIEEIASILRSNGASEKVWAISQDRHIDGQELDLESALTYISGSHRGTFLSCIPGKLAYFKEEEGSQLLKR